MRLWSLTLACFAASCAEDHRAEPDDVLESPDAGDASSPGSRDSGTRADARTASTVDARAEVEASAPHDGGGKQGDAAAALMDTVVTETIVVRSGETFDGSGKRFIAGPALGDGSQDEDQKPVFKLENGAKLTNVTLGSPAADGIHTHGNVQLENIVWQDIGEDALTIKESGTVELRGGSARDGEDKVFQINAASVFRVSDFTAVNAGKFIRQNGGTKFKVEVYIDRCDISRMDEAIFRTDSSTSTVALTNTRYSQIGDSLFIGLTPERITEMNNTEY